MRLRAARLQQHHPHQRHAVADAHQRRPLLPGRLRRDRGQPGGANGNTGEIQVWFHKNGWGNYNETGDYSFDATKTALRRLEPRDPVPERHAGLGHRALARAIPRRGSRSCCACPCATPAGARRSDPLAFTFVSTDAVPSDTPLTAMPPAPSWRRASDFDGQAPTSTSRSTISAPSPSNRLRGTVIDGAAASASSSISPPMPRRSPPPNSASVARSTRASSASPWTRRVRSSASARCPSRSAPGDASNASISSRGRNGQPAQEAADVGVLAVQPELIERERRRQLRIEEHRARLALAVFLAGGVGQQRRRHAVDGASRQPPHEIDARHDVAPLVGRAALQPAAVALVQLEEVVRLQQHVRELGVRDPLLARLEARLDGVALDHLVDREVLADVAQEVQQPQRRPAIPGCRRSRTGGPSSGAKNDSSWRAQLPASCRSPRRCPAACARSTCPTDRRSSRSRRPPARSPVPGRRSWLISISGTRLPACRLRADGSNPT